ncbi:MAG: hypothetical protein FOGNACKC_06130 [Anaerolineae bacterium]|nr:hypothetical protein [Anaerolineae bacterium]
MDKLISLTAIPFALSWDIPPQQWQLEPDETLAITAGPITDLFTDPGGTVVKNDSSRLLFAPPAEFVLSARVTVDFASTFDAGVLVLYAGPDFWAKLCFEFSPQGQPMVVSVVNRHLSDDCNSVVINGNSVYLRIAGLGQAFAFHYSTDGQTWHMVRYFSLGQPDSLRAGFSAQSPTGQSCTARFSAIDFAARRLAELRDGS